MVESHSRRHPVVFLGHGSPMNALSNTRFGAAWRKLGATLPRPRAILCFSAHWLTRGTAVTAMDRPRTIHDFSGFPPELYERRYPAPGDPALAARVRELLAPTEVAPDQAWGLDHGSWGVLVHLYPDADIPVVQLSMDATKPPAFHYELARRLRPLRDEGVLILGSGNIVHNLRAIRGVGAEPWPWAVQFDEAVKSALLRADDAALIDYQQLAPDAALSVPTVEHYLPLLYVVAQREADDSVTFPVEGLDLGSLSMRAVALGLGAA